MSRNPQAQYSFRDTAATMGGRYGGQYITNSTVDTYSPPWGGVSTIRILPTRVPADGGGVRLTPFRNSQDVNDVGDWVRCYFGVKSFGAGPDGNGVSFIVSDPADPTAPPKEESPPFVLFNAISSAIKSQQEQTGWASLLQGGHQKGAVLARPKPLYLVNALIMQHREQIYNPPKGWAQDAKPQIVVLSDSAGQALMNLANGIREDADPHDMDWTRVSKCGDLIGLGQGQGQFVTFYRSSDGDPRQRAVQMAAGGGAQRANFGAAAAQGGGGGTGFATYCAYADPAFLGTSADFSHMADYLAARTIQWDQVLTIPTFEQQAMWIADKFPPSAICYAFQDHPHWIPQRVMDAYLARTRQAGQMMPVNGFVGAYGAAAPQQFVQGQPQTAQWGATVGMPVTTPTTAGAAYLQTAVANAANMVAQQQPQQPQQPQQFVQEQPNAAAMGAVPFLVDALTTPTGSDQVVQGAQVQQAAAVQQAPVQQAAPAGWGTAGQAVPQTQAQPAASMTGMAAAAAGIPVAVTQATVAASNAAQQPAAGFAMPVVAQQPAAAVPPQHGGMSRSQAALMAAQQAAQGSV